MAERDLSVVVFGATGITGRLVAAYLAERVKEDGIPWAAAGREPAKVKRVLAELGAEAPETIAADVGDPGSLREMAARAKVVVDLVGPYTLYGEPVIEACIESGADYIDLTGELPFVRAMIDAHEAAAIKAGVKVVNTSGFEALPADLVVRLAAETARERWDEDLATADLNTYMSPPPGRLTLADSFSGGTLQTLAVGLEDDRAGLLSDSAVLLPDPQAADAVRTRSPIAVAPRFDSDGEPIGPMMPSPFINPAVVQRSAFLATSEADRAFSPFRYREGSAVPVSAPKPLRYALAAGGAGLQKSIAALTRAGAGTRSRVSAGLRRVLPGSGFGPSGERMEDWSWRMRVDATTSDGHHVRTELEAEGQPGYLTTGRMIGEAGLLLAEEGGPDRSGFLTPAIALGTERLARFERAGVRFRVAS